MNTNEVVEMIDAITEGNAYEMDVDVSADSIDGLLVSFGECVVFRPNSNVTSSTIDNPRTARKIAGALITWAIKEEGRKDTKNQALRALDIYLTSDIEYPSVNDWADIAARRITREDWYSRHVSNMSPESIQRNIKTLEDQCREWAPTSVNYMDVQKALAILRNALGNNPAWREDWYRRNIGNISQATKDRNLKDLLGILNTRNLAPSERKDIEAAVHVLRMNGAKDV